MATPCIRICRIDPRTGLCSGCGRTTTEIVLWTSYSDDERLAIMAVLAARLGDGTAAAVAGTEPA